MLPAITSIALLVTACNASEPPRDSSEPIVAAAASLPSIALSPAFTKLAFARPVQITHAGDGTNRLFVVEQSGRIRVFPHDQSVSGAAVFLDLTHKVLAPPKGFNEEGLLSLAFHPRYRENGLFYIYYSVAEPKRGVLSRFSVAKDDPNRADPESEHVLLEVAQPWPNHNGSTVLFGPDGYLYMSLGDGGAANDPLNSGQDLSTLLGTIIRIDVDHQQDGLPYAIPADNPFVAREGARPEIWAYGLRNIWRMSFDRATGELWGGDIGQNAYEEIDLIVKGGNYGWNIREGFHPFDRRRQKRSPDPVDPLIDPVVEYPRDQGISVTGGHVYRGSSMPQLVGAYLYADYWSGRVWALRHENEKVVAHREVFRDSRKFITSFGEDEAGELFVCCFDSYDGRGSHDGRIYKIVVR